MFLLRMTGLRRSAVIGQGFGLTMVRKGVYISIRQLEIVRKEQAQWCWLATPIHVFCIRNH